jgi:hypothetical protein
MATLAQVRDGLEARLSTIPDLRVYNHLPDDAGYPAALISRAPIPNYGESLGYGDTLHAIFRIILLVPSNVSRKQLDLYPFLELTGPQSIPAVIEADHSLGGLAVDARVVDATEADISMLGLTNVFGVSLNVLAIISS